MSVVMRDTNSVKIRPTPAMQHDVELCKSPRRYRWAFAMKILFLRLAKIRYSVGGSIAGSENAVAEGGFDEVS